MVEEINRKIRPVVLKARNERTIRSFPIRKTIEFFDKLEIILGGVNTHEH